MTMPPQPDGWARLLLESKFGMGRDFRALDPQTEEQVYYVDGKVNVRPVAEIQDAAGAALFTVKGQVVSIPRRMTISDAAGQQIAELKAKAFSLVKNRMTLAFADGKEWVLEGSFIEKNYSVTSEGAPIIQISQKWVTIRDRYTIDVAPGIEPGLALALMWAVDRWVERD
jgi:uncharacterized protein YxjI